MQLKQVGLLDFVVLGVVSKQKNKGIGKTRCTVFWVTWPHVLGLATIQALYSWVNLGHMVCNSTNFGSMWVTWFATEPILGLFDFAATGEGALHTERWSRKASTATSLPVTIFSASSTVVRFCTAGPSFLPIQATMASLQQSKNKILSSCGAGTGRELGICRNCSLGPLAGVVPGHAVDEEEEGGVALHAVRLRQVVLLGGVGAALRRRGSGVGEGDLVARERGSKGIWRGRGR